MGHHPHLDGELFTPKDEKFWETLEMVKVQCGGSWKAVVRQARLSTRMFRRVRKDDARAVSWRVMDKLLSRTGFPHLMESFEWYTPDELVEMGIWKPHSTVGLNKSKKATVGDES
jgi:hypothetical protein